MVYRVKAQRHCTENHLCRGGHSHKRAGCLLTSSLPMLFFLSPAVESSLIVGILCVLLSVPCPRSPRSAGEGGLLHFESYSRTARSACQLRQARQGNGHPRGSRTAPAGDFSSHVACVVPIESLGLHSAVCTDCLLGSLESTREGGKTRTRRGESINV